MNCCFQNKMKIVLLLIIGSTSYIYAQHTAYWNHKVSMHFIMPNQPNEIIFLGDSITDRCEWFELFSNPNVRNRGLSGDNTSGVLDRLTEVTESYPDKVFIMIGVNDLRSGRLVSEIVSNYKQIITRIKGDSPATEIYIQSLLPVNNLVGDSETTNTRVTQLNSELKIIAENDTLTFINLFELFTDNSGNLDEIYTEDGLHINGEGYLVWKAALEEIVNVGTDVLWGTNSNIIIDDYSMGSFPNPFNGELSISYVLPKQTSTKIVIYDILGKRIYASNREVHQAGQHSFRWNSKNINSGTYIVVLYADGHLQSTNKVILLK